MGVVVKRYILLLRPKMPVGTKSCIDAENENLKVLISFSMIYKPSEFIVLMDLRHLENDALD